MTQDELDLDFAALCLVTEDNEPHAYLPLMWVLRNRVESRRYPNTYREVVLQPSQFSAFNALSDERREFAASRLADATEVGQWLGTSLTAEALDAAHEVTVSRRFEAPFSHRVLYFYAPRSMKPTGSKPPWWDAEVVNTIHLPGLTRWVFGEVR